MNITFIAILAGFVAATALLIFFISKYRSADYAAEETPQNFEDDAPALSPAAKAEAAEPFLEDEPAVAPSSSSPSKEVSDLKDQLKDLHYRFEEVKLLGERRSAEAAKALARMEERITAFENEYVNKLQPTLQSLITELENIQTKS